MCLVSEQLLQEPALCVPLRLHVGLGVQLKSSRDVRLPQELLYNEGSRFLGNDSPALIDQVGEGVDTPASPFQVVPEFQYLCALRNARLGLT